MIETNLYQSPAEKGLVGDSILIFYLHQKHPKSYEKRKLSIHILFFRQFHRRIMQRLENLVLERFLSHRSVQQSRSDADRKVGPTLMINRTHPPPFINGHQSSPPAMNPKRKNTHYIIRSRSSGRDRSDGDAKVGHTCDQLRPI